MSLCQILRGTFQKFIGTAPQGITQTNFLRPTTLNSWSIDFIRTKTRNHFPRPNEAKRIKRHGFWTRMATKEGRRILQRRILKGRYVLMLFKSLGCRPLNLFRCFNNAVDVSKVKQKKHRHNNYYVPILSEQKIQSIKKIVSLQITGQYLICTNILRDGNILTDWKLLSMPENMDKFNLNDVYNSVTMLLNNLPESDVYLIENFIRMPNNMNVTGTNLFYVRLQTLSMLIALINSGHKENSSNKTESTNKVLLVKGRLQARLFRIIVGSEVISSQDITELMIKGTFPEYVTPVVPTIDAILTFKSTKEPLIKEFMSNGLLLAITFIDLVLNSNPNTIQALNKSAKRQLKNTIIEH